MTAKGQGRDPNIFKACYFLECINVIFCTEYKLCTVGYVLGGQGNQKSDFREVHIPVLISITSSVA